MMSITELLMKKKIEAKATMNGNASAWPSIKPFVNGCLVGQATLLPAFTHYLSLKHCSAAYGPHRFSNFNHNLNIYAHYLRSALFIQATCSAAQLGMFETLTKKVADANGGTPITLYQEAGCGLIAGGVASSIYYPLNARIPRPGKLHFRELFNSLHSSIRKDGFFALWKGGSPMIVRQMAFDMGMLTSYGRTLKYLEESVGVNRIRAQIVVSAFFGVTCGNSCDLLVMIKNALRQNGKRYPFAALASRVFKDFFDFAPFCTYRWTVLKLFRELEESLGF